MIGCAPWGAVQWGREEGGGGQSRGGSFTVVSPRRATLSIYSSSRRRKRKRKKRGDERITKFEAAGLSNILTTTSNRNISEKSAVKASSRDAYKRRENDVRVFFYLTHCRVRVFVSNFPSVSLRSSVQCVRFLTCWYISI